MSAALESEIAERNLNLNELVPAIDACFDFETGPTELKNGGLSAAQTKPRAAMNPWWKPTSRLDWFSSYTLRAVFLIVSFWAIGLIASSMTLSL
jgi:hypothetical protein